MLLKLETPQILADVINIISELVTEVKIRVDDSGMGMTAIDPANVAMVSFHIPKNAFSQYESDAETIGVNLDSLKQVLRRCKAGSSLIMNTEDNLFKLQIIDRIKRNFTLSLIDVGGDDKESLDKKIKDLEDGVSSRIEIDSVDFVSSIEDCSIVSDACSFSVKDNNFFIEARGLNSAMSEFSSDEINISAENCRAKYSLEYLQKFIKGSKLSSKTSLKFSNDYPLRIDYQNEKVSLSFVLAPRVETED